MFKYSKKKRSFHHFGYLLLKIHWYLFQPTIIYLIFFKSSCRGILINVSPQISLKICISAISLMEYFDCNGYYSCKRVIIAVLLREQAEGGQNITVTRGDGHRFLVTVSLLMALLYTIYEGCTSKGAVYFYMGRNKVIRVIYNGGKHKNILENIFNYVSAIINCRIFKGDLKTRCYVKHQAKCSGPLVKFSTLHISHKPEDLGFDSPWGPRNVFLTLSFRPQYGAGVY